MVLLWLLWVVFNGLSTSCSRVDTFAILGNICKQGLLKLEEIPLGGMPRPEASSKEPNDSTVSLVNVRFGYTEDKEVLHVASAVFPACAVSTLVGPPVASPPSSN